jgi:hypothetical protein
MAGSINRCTVYACGEHREDLKEEGFIKNFQVVGKIQPSLRSF